jgi:hypothetical protein
MSVHFSARYATRPMGTSVCLSGECPLSERFFSFLTARLQHSRVSSAFICGGSDRFSHFPFPYSFSRSVLQQSAVRVLCCLVRIAKRSSPHKSISLGILKHHSARPSRCYPLTVSPPPVFPLLVSLRLCSCRRCLVGQQHAPLPHSAPSRWLRCCCWAARWRPSSPKRRTCRRVS